MVKVWSCVPVNRSPVRSSCLLYPSDAADERSSVALGGRRIIKKKNSVTWGGQMLAGDGGQGTTG